MLARVSAAHQRREPPPAHGDAGSARGFGRLTTAHAAFIAHLLSLLGTLGVLVYYGRHQWFFADEWEFITRNLPGPHRLGLFVPHNEHWSTIPILIYRALFAVFGLHSYLPYILVLIVLHLAAAHLLWRLAVRAGASAWIATSIAALFLLLGVGWEQMVSAFQMGFSLSLVCGLGWLLVTGGDLPGPTRLLSGWALGVAGSMSTGIGIPMIGGVAVAALARRGSRDAVAVVSVPVLANLAWFASVHPRATLPSTTQQLWMLPQFVWHGLSATADGALGLPVVGSVLLVALVAWLVARARTVSPMALGSAAGAVFLFILVGYGRISLGVDQAAASRYLYLAAALLGCPAALALTEMSRRRPVLEALLVAGLAVSTLHGAYVLRLSIRGQLAIRLQDRAIVMAAARVVSSGATVLGTHPDPVYGPDIDVPDLRTLVRTGALPVTGAVDAASLITVESRLEMSAGSSPAVTGPPPIATILDGTRSGTGSCDVQPVTSGETARVRLAFSGPASFSMTGGPAELVTAVLSSSQTGAIAAATVTYQLHQGTPLWISVTAPGAVLSVAVPGPTSLGGVGAC